MNEKKKIELLVDKFIDEHGKEKVSMRFYWNLTHQFGLCDTIDKEESIMEACKNTIAVLQKWGLSIVTDRNIDPQKLLQHKDYPIVKKEKKFFNEILNNVEIIIKEQDTRKTL